MNQEIISLCAEIDSYFKAWYKNQNIEDLIFYFELVERLKKIYKDEL